MMEKSRANIKTNHEWWRGATIYQIYPRSFFDTTGNGIGDLRGCIEKLDYIASLGVDAVWLSPVFQSPMRDFGYDVSDYTEIDPLFGTLKDFDELVSKIHERDMKILIDQIYSHTSDLHAWFQESRKNKKNNKADWYVWQDARADGSPPTNWQSVFGGSAWEWDNTRCQYYLHNFLSSQPDLNLHKKEVQDAILDVAKFWLDRDVDGFRLDAINFAMHDTLFRDNPPAAKTQKAPTRPFDFQEHLYNQSHPDIEKFLERLGLLSNSYSNQRFTVAEVVGPTPLKEMKAFTSQGRLSSAYNFDYLYANKITQAHVRSTTANWSATQEVGWPAWAFSNHDTPRVASRWTDNHVTSIQSSLFAMVLLSLRGTIFLYQGEELGLLQADIPFEHLQDPEAISNWPATLGRDGARSPLPWAREEIFAGFSTQSPWLPIDPRHSEMAVDTQDKDPTSMLNFVRELIHFRHGNLCLRLGDLEFLDTPNSLLAFYRLYKDQKLLCIFNLSEDLIDWRLPYGKSWTIETSNSAFKKEASPAINDQGIVSIRGYCGFIAKLVS